jgi:hypothetical protein
MLPYYSGISGQVMRVKVVSVSVGLQLGFYVMFFHFQAVFRITSRCGLRNLVLIMGNPVIGNVTVLINSLKYHDVWL